MVCWNWYDMLQRFHNEAHVKLWVTGKRIGPGFSVTEGDDILCVLLHKCCYLSSETGIQCWFYYNF